MIDMCDGKLKLYSGVTETTVDWLWYPFIPYGKLTLLQGDPGCGKSTLMMNLIAAVSSGSCSPDGKKIKKPLHVIYQCSEDGISDTIKPRLLTAGADCNNVAFLDEETDWITLNDEKIRRAIADFNAKLLVIDPVQAYLGETDIASAAAMRKMLRQLAAWAAMYDCAVVLIGHLNKKQGSKDLYGDTSFLFTGDAERETEQAILGSKQDIQSTVLKVGHHGSESSTGYLWLREVMPKYAVISVGKDNTYGHPTDEVLSRLRDAEVTTFRTDMQGDISCVSDGKTVEFTVSRNKDADVFASIGTNSTQKTVENNATEPAAKSEPVGQTYVLNTNTKKFHIPTCRSVKQMKDKNKKDFCGSREEVIAKGYSPCKICNP